MHNRERAAVGVPPLVWSNKLAADAKPWAEHLATTPEFGHNGPELKALGEGENIAGFQLDVGPSAPGNGQSLWVDEKENYHGGPISMADFSNGAPPIGHYTQMVWRTTTQVGCATATGGGNPFSILVCRTARRATPWGRSRFRRAGEKWKVAINNAIIKSRFFIALLSSNSVDKVGYGQNELKEALEILDKYPESKVFIIPVKLDDCEVSDSKLKEINYVDLFPSWRGGFQKILETIDTYYNVLRRLKQYARIADLIYPKNETAK